MRLIRVLVYEGDDNFLLDALHRRGVKEKHIIKNNSITEAYIGFSGDLFADFFGPIIAPLRKEDSE